MYSTGRVNDSELIERRAQRGKSRGPWRENLLFFVLFDRSSATVWIALFVVCRFDFWTMRRGIGRKRNAAIIQLWYWRDMIGMRSGANWEGEKAVRLLGL